MARWWASAATAIAAGRLPAAVELVGHGPHGETVVDVPERLERFIRSKGFRLGDLPQQDAEPTSQDDEQAADLSVLDSSIKNLHAELATGAYDEHLFELLEAEERGRNRKGARNAIGARFELLG